MDGDLRNPLESCQVRVPSIMEPSLLKSREGLRVLRLLVLAANPSLSKCQAQVAIEDVIEFRYDLEATAHMPLLVRLRTVLSKDERHRHKVAGVGRRADISICEN